MKTKLSLFFLHAAVMLFYLQFHPNNVYADESRGKASPASILKITHMESINSNRSTCEARLMLTVLYNGSEDLRKYFAEHVLASGAYSSSSGDHLAGYFPVLVENVTRMPKNKYMVEVSLYLSDPIANKPPCRDVFDLGLQFTHRVTQQDWKSETNITEPGCCQSVVVFEPGISPFLCFSTDPVQNYCIDLAIYEIYMGEAYFKIIELTEKGELKTDSTISIDCRQKTYGIRGLTIHSERGRQEVPVEYTKRYALSNASMSIQFCYSLVCGPNGAIRNKEGIRQAYDDLKVRLGTKTIPVPEVVRKFR